MKKHRILIGILGLDQHEVGAVAVARLLRDSGMEVIYAGLFNTPAGLVETALHEDVDLIGLSCHSWEYLHYLPEVFDLLRENDAEIPVVVGGSVITPRDAKQLNEMGVSACFGPGSTSEEIVRNIQHVLKNSPEIS